MRQIAQLVPMVKQLAEYEHMATISSLLVGIAMAAAAHAQGRQSEAPNAAVHYRRAFAALPELSEDESTLLLDGKMDPQSASARTVLKKSSAAVGEVMAAANISHCDWGPWTQKDLDFSGDRFMKTSELGRLVCLSARDAFGRSQSDQGLAQLAAVLKLANDSGRHGPWIAKLVQVALEGRVIDILELQLPQYDKEKLRAVENWLRTLPKRGRIDEATKGERAFMQFHTSNVAKQTNEQSLAALKVDPLGVTEKEEAEATWKLAGESTAGLVKLYERSITLLDELDRILLMPSDKAVLAFEEHRKKYKDVNPPTCSISRVVEKVRSADDRVRFRMKLLQAATAILLHGREALGDLKDPFGRPVVYEAKDGGFELRSDTFRAGMPLATVTIRNIVGKNNP